MADFTTLKMQVNTGTSDASPTFTDMLLTTANYELRLCGPGAGGASIASASWPIFYRPAVVAPWTEMWGYFGSDASGGQKVTTYDGTAAHYKQLLLSWDALGTFASGQILSAWKDNTYSAASPGTQPGTGDGSSYINGSSDTSNTGYIKANAYGSGVTAGGTQETPSSNIAGTLAATSGTAGAVSPGAAAWLATWQSLQAATQNIQAGVTPKALTPGLWYIGMVWYVGPGMTPGTLVPVVGVQYTWV